MSILLSGELEVDGDLKVTGTVESATIDSLKAVIADLQAQLAALNTHTTCLLRMVEFSGSPADDNVHLCTEGLSEPDCYNYYNFDSELQINIEENLWSSTSSCSDLGHSNIFDLCIESNEILADTSHCNLTWYCSGDCESLLEEDEELVPSESGCMLQDAPNYDASALLPCTTDCINGQTGANCCCEIIYGCDALTGVELLGEYFDIETTYIDLSNLGLSGSIPPEIGCLTNLIGLWLYGNQLTGEIPSEIGNLTNLETLNLYFNQLTGEIPPEIGNLTNLNGLYLDNNQLTGEIPYEIGDLENLIWLSLYNNQLTGEIPSEIGQLTNLSYLNLNSNQLTGSIPSEIGNLTNLEHLDLHNNFLTGEIPPAVCDLINNNNLDINNITSNNNLINTCE